MKSFLMPSFLLLLFALPIISFLAGVLVGKVWAGWED